MPYQTPPPSATATSTCSRPSRSRATGSPSSSTRPGSAPRSCSGSRRELRQFESVFLTAADEPDVFGARVFTVEEELPFAGHPALGAAAVLHKARAPDGDAKSFVLAFPAGRVRLDSARVGRGAYHVAMDQGEQAFRQTLGEDERTRPSTRWGWGRPTSRPVSRWRWRRPGSPSSCP